MNRTIKQKIISLVLVVAMLVSSLSLLVACINDSTVYYDNDKDALVFSIQELDGVFNPFFSTSATDSSVVGMTQISMLANDAQGNVAYGDSEAVVVKDLEVVTTGEGEDKTTTYYFVLKNNVRFSNGSYLSMKDVLFNLYVYLDPQYTGSATMYSTDIVGLQEYRTQETTETEQKAFKGQFEDEADTRIEALIDACDEIVERYKYDSLDVETLVAELETKATAVGTSTPYVLADFNKANELFKEELESDYSNSLNSYQDQVFKDADGEEHKNLFSTDVEMFLYNEGIITWNKKDGKLESSATSTEEELKSWTKEQAINFVYNYVMPKNVSQVLQYWQTASNLNEYLTNLAMEEYFATHETAIKSISGIKFANKTEAVTVNGVQYDAPTYVVGSNNTQVETGNEVLSITIKKIDPKAIWNFAFAVAPMYYYSNEEQIAKFDYTENFGVEYASQSFMTNVVKSADKIGLPVGAGPYAASKASGGLSNIDASDFYQNSIVYYEANPYYVMGRAKINKVQYKVVSSSGILNALYTNEVDFAEPNAKPETITELAGKSSEGIGYKAIRTSGYGYIGINAGKVPSIKIRQLIMHCINTQECVDYYKTTADAIYRSMSKTSWAYPDGCTSYYPYIAGEIPEDLTVVNPEYAQFVESKGYTAGEVMTDEDQNEFLLQLIDEAGYTKGSDGIYQKNGKKLSYTFTIAGADKDHPAYGAMKHASEILNKIGFQIKVATDENALKKLATGDLAVWAAAWGSTIDPDMYQVYHIDSTATSVLNWGYKQIKANIGSKYDYELGIVEELSEIIDQARETDNQDERALLYSEALDLVMQLAVELPTYQRDDLFAYDASKIDATTFNQNPSSFLGLTSDIHTISLVVEK